MLGLRNDLEFQARLNPSAMDFLMDVVLPKSLFGRIWAWLTGKGDMLLDMCTTAVMNAWNYCKSKVRNVSSCCSSSDGDGDEDRYDILFT